MNIREKIRDLSNAIEDIKDGRITDPEEIKTIAQDCLYQITQIGNCVDDIENSINTVLEEANEIAKWTY